MLSKVMIDKDLRDLRDAIDSVVTCQGSWCDAAISEVLQDAVNVGLDAVNLNDDGGSTWSDLGMSDAVAEIDTCCLQGGSRFLRDVVGQPSADIGILRRRRTAIELHRKLRAFWAPGEGIFHELQSLEADVLWLLSLPSDEMAMALDIVYFKTWPLRYLNKMPSLLTGLNVYRSVLAPFLCIATPLLYALVAYLIIAYKFSNLGLRISPAAFLRFFLQSAGAPFTNDSVRRMYLGITFVMYVQNAVNTCEFARLVTRITRHTVKRAHRALRFLDLSERLYERYFTQEVKAFVSGERHVQWPRAPDTIDNVLAMTSWCGDHLCFMKYHDRHSIVASLRATYALDMVDALARSDAGKYTFASFQCARVPLLARRVGYPGLASAVANDFDGRVNHIITGPNAGGKSTFLKSIGVVVMMAQSITLVRAESVAIASPFRVLRTHMRIEDRVGHASLFQTEVARCKGILDAVRGGQGCPSLILLDELFNSTNADDGTTAAIRFCTEVGKVSGAVLAVATHYAGLADIRSTLTEGRRFAVFRTQVLDGGRFTFVIEPGASTVRNGLRLAEDALDLSSTPNSSKNIASNTK